LIYWDSGSGISHDVEILEQILHSLGISIRRTITRNKKTRLKRLWHVLLQVPVTILRKNDFQIHIEQIHPEQFRYSKKNFILPNPEITDIRTLNKIQVPYTVLCKSHHAEALFGEIGCQLIYTGFTSPDRIDGSVRKDYRRFLHAAGASNFKGTMKIVEVWKRNPQWPKLTIVRTLEDCYGAPRAHIEGTDNLEVIEKWIPSEDYLNLQNECGIHLCPSEMEGFGHYIMEGLSCGSVVLTTDAAPMNELVNDDCGFLVKASLTGKSYMSDRWTVDADALEKTINQIIELPVETLESLGSCARNRYDLLDREFRERISRVLEEI